MYNYRHENINLCWATGC